MYAKVILQIMFYALSNIAFTGVSITYWDRIIQINTVLGHLCHRKNFQKPICKVLTYTIYWVPKPIIYDRFLLTQFIDTVY